MATGRVGKMGAKAKSLITTTSHPPFLKIFIPAQQAKPTPPLGPQLGKPDRTYTIETTHPPSFFLLKLAAGCKRGASKPGTEVAGMVSLKHIYEIAKLKQSDSSLQPLSLESICKSIIGTAHLMGIQVLSKEQIDSKAVDYTPEGYARFLDKRNEQILQHRKALEEKKQAKMLRIS